MVSSPKIKMDIFKSLWLLLVCLTSLVRAEIFTSMAQMQQAFVAQRSLGSQLLQYVTDERARLDVIENLAREMEDEVMKDDPITLLGHPVNAFLYSQRFTTRWESLQTQLNTLAEQNKEKLNTAITGALEQVPQKEDTKGAATALFRLQDTYQLSTASLADGGQIGAHVSPRLTAHQCHTLGMIAYDSRDFYHSTLWMNTALEKLDDEKNATVERARVLEYLSFLHGEYQLYDTALNHSLELVELEPEHDFAAKNYQFYEKKISERENATDVGPKGETGETSDKKGVWRKDVDSWDLNYEALCRGERVKENPYEHVLTCRYETNGHPFLLLGPLKLEEAYFNPDVLLFHDFIGDNDIDTLTNISANRLERAGVFKIKGQQTNIVDFRTSKHTWLADWEHKVVQQQTQLVGAATKLDQQTSEHLQVNNYGIGGHYSAHLDHARKGEEYVFDEEQGNRIATFLYYMNDVDAGGATVFVNIGITVFPEKGMGLFWHNLHRSGEGNVQTMHAGCPVLAGNKWVANKWIHERGQEFLRPCTLDENE